MEEKKITMSIELKGYKRYMKQARKIEKETKQLNENLEKTIELLNRLMSILS
ncbi:MAG: hypothetical protein LUE92_06020 [Clostridiales bacterium]|nr:hypothetical protein [Clostridiales bacterium]